MKLRERWSYDDGDIDDDDDVDGSKGGDVGYEAKVGIYTPIRQEEEEAIEYFERERWVESGRRTKRKAMLVR